MSEIGDCPICWDTFVKPRGLPCLHYFCTTCLQQYIDNTHLEPAGFRCPCCRKLCVPDNKLLPVKMWAEGFPVANLINELLMKLGIIKKNEKMIPPSLGYCNNCIQNYAIAFCKNCQFNLCFGCYYKHLQEKNHMVNKNCLGSPLTCLKHTKMIPEFCYKCLMFTCPVCAASNHAACKEEDAVKSCEEAVEKLKEKNQINIAKLKSLQTHYENELRNVSKILNKMQNETNAEGSDHCQRLKKLELDDEMVEIQHLLRKINNELECLKLHQKTENSFLYLHEYTSLFKLNETNKERFNLISHSPAQNGFS